MTKTATRVRILMTPSSGHDDDDRPQPHAGPATVLTGLPRMIRRHELRLIVPLADSTIFEMERRGEFPRRFNLSPRCVVWDLAEVEAWLQQRRSAYFAGEADIASTVDVRHRKCRPVKPKG
jgi:prophage regulatory protein